EYVKFPCEDGGFCSAYSLFQYPDLSDFTNGFSISFNRKAGGSDVEVPINLLRDKPEAYAAHAKCMVRLLDIIKENLPK
ncbi:MAG TPA: hypothetical protein VFB16_00250, partial [Bauldia sp.]|nr:hypothetical protein [Bauldia sp.]